MKDISQSNRIPSLDGIRAIAIFFVLICHYGAGVINHPFSIHVLIWLGHLGVDIFFVVSGYLITYLLRREIEKFGNIDFRGFYLRRAIRIFPAFYLFLGFICFLTLFGILKLSFLDITSAGIFLQNYSFLWIHTPGKDIPFIQHIWSLSLEEQFYLFWPLTFVSFGRMNALWLSIGLIVLSPILRIATYYLFPEYLGGIGIMTHTAIDPIMFGCAIALAEGLPKFEYIVQIISKYQVAAFVSFFLLFSPVLRVKSLIFYGVGIGRTVESIAISIVIIWLVRNANTAVGKFCNSKLIVHFGILSYSIYLWQEVFLIKLNTTWSGVFPLNFLCCYVAAELSYRLIEQPFLKLRKYFKRDAVSGGIT